MEVKSIFASKVAWTGIITLLFTLAKSFGFLPDGLTEPMVTEAVYAVLAVLVVVFRLGPSTDTTVTGKPPS